MTREFILNTLLPYKEDPSTCAVEDKDIGCLYLTSDGRKCALGKHLKEGIHQNYIGRAISLFNVYGMNSILTQEAIDQDISVDIWRKIQKYHDELAYEGKNTCNRIISELETLTGFKFPELYFNEQ